MPAPAPPEAGRKRTAPERQQTPGATSEPAAASNSVGALAADPELASFRAAHDLHFKAGQPRQAIAAYAAYLKAYPNGRFVPEASYNTALNWIKLGDKAAARHALRPFASGTYGEYRRSEAQQLLDALR
jgi:hypothetical protein